jgi:hypothetical protein
VDAAEEEKYVDLWIGARWGLRSGAYGGTIAGIALGLSAAALVLFTDFQLTGLEVFSVFWIAGVYGFILGILGGALGGLIAGAIAGAVSLPQNLPLTGALTGAGLGAGLIIVFFLLYVWLNGLLLGLDLLLDLAPAALVGAVGGGLGGFFGGRRFAKYYERHPPLSAYDNRWDG